MKGDLTKVDGRDRRRRAEQQCFADQACAAVPAISITISLCGSGTGVVHADAVGVVDNEEVDLTTARDICETHALRCDGQVRDGVLPRVEPGDAALGPVLGLGVSG